MIAVITATDGTFNVVGTAHGHFTVQGNLTLADAMELRDLLAEAIEEHLSKLEEQAS